MGADYAKRIVARVSGRPLAAAPLMAPRGIIESKPADESDPFEMATTVEAGSPEDSRPRPAMASREPADWSDQAGAPFDAHPAPATPRTPPASAAEGPAPAISRITEEVATRSIVAHERIIEQVVVHREASPSPVEMRPAKRSTPDTAAEPAATRRDQSMSRKDETSERLPDGDREHSRAAARRRKDDAATVHGSREPSLVPAVPAARRPPEPRKATPPPMRPRPIPQAFPVPRRARDRAQLVIGRLVVEVVPSTPIAAPRPVARPAPSGPAPFRAGGPPNLAVGRPSGLGQG